MAKMSSPSEFLTFYRTAVRASRPLQRNSVSRATIRPFSASISSRYPGSSEKSGNEIGGPTENKKHVLEKDHEPNVQAYESKKGRENRAQGTGGTATEQEDPKHREAQKTKDDHPERPDNIGMQDERGGKGH